MTTLLRSVCFGLVLAVGLLSSSREAWTKSDLEKLRGERVAVTTKGGKVVRGWLLRVWPKKILVAPGNNTFVHIFRTNIVRIRAQNPISRPGPASTDSQPSPPKTTREQLAAAKRVRNAGIGVTVTGLVIFAGGWIGGAIDPFMGLAIGGLLVGSGIGGTVTVAGSITWVVGGVRLSIASAGLKWRAKRKAWIRGGQVVTASGGGLAVIGSAMLTLWSLSDRVGGPVGGVGVILLSTGLLTSLLVGVPMWATAHLFSAATNPSPPRTPGKPGATAAGRRSLDPLHEMRRGRLLHEGAPRATLFTTGFVF